MIKDYPELSLTLVEAVLVEWSVQEVFVDHFLWKWVREDVSVQFIRLGGSPSAIRRT